MKKVWYGNLLWRVKTQHAHLDMLFGGEGVEV
jgi:hypothetical protein